MSEKIHAPVHPGEILEEEFLRPPDLTQVRLARAMSVSPRRIHDIVRGRRGITADTALRLARFFGTTPRFWMNLQVHYDLESRSDELGADLDREVSVMSRSKR